MILYLQLWRIFFINIAVMADMDYSNRFVYLGIELHIWRFRFRRTLERPRKYGGDGSCSTFSVYD